MRTKSVSETNVPAPFDKVAECVLKWSESHDVRNVITLSARLSFNFYDDKQLCGQVYLRDDEQTTLLDVRMVIPEGTPFIGLVSAAANTQIMREAALGILETLQANGLVSADNWEMRRFTLIETTILESFEKVAELVKKRKLTLSEKDGRAEFNVYEGQLLVGCIRLHEEDWQTVLEIEVMFPVGLAPSPMSGMPLNAYMLYKMRLLAEDLYKRLHQREFVSAEYLDGVVSGDALMTKYRPG